MTTLDTYPLDEAKAQALRSSDNVAQLRKKARSVSKKTILNQSPEILWPLVSYTDLLNLQVGMNATTNYYANRDYGGTWMHAETKNAGFQVAYEELPYEWEAPQRYRVERIYSKGPLKYMSFGVALKSLDAEKTEVTCEIQFVSPLPAPVSKVLINKELNKFIDVFQKLDAQLQKGKKSLRAYFDASTQLEAKIVKLAMAWEAFSDNSATAFALADYILRAPERLAYRVRPYELAELYLLDPLDVLKLCLRLTREEQLHLMWDCRCPGCKGPKESYRHLNEVANLAYCPTCALQYNMAFDQNLELTFQPSAAIRPTQELYFCAGSPGNTPHISWQQNLHPESTARFDLNLPPGDYVMRSLSLNNELMLSVQAGAQTEAVLSLNSAFETEADALVLAPGATLELSNKKPYEMTVMLENIHWQAQAVTAGEVQSVQAFHDLFPEEILAPGETLPLSHQLFLVVRPLFPPDTDSGQQTEITDWIASQIRQLDGAALTANSEQILGLFARSFEALSAAWTLVQGLDELNLLYDQPVQLALGLGGGPCEVDNHRGQLRYQGAGRDQADLAAAASQGQDIVVQEALLNAPEMHSFLEDPLFEARRIEGQSLIRFVYQDLALAFES